MTTYILTNYKISTTAESEQNYFTSKVFYEGDEIDLHILLKDNHSKNISPKQSILALTGKFKEELNPFKISLLDAEQIELPESDNWLTFFIFCFIENRANCIRIFESEEYVTITPQFEHYHFWITLSKDRKILNKLEFGRWLPKENSEFKRKSTSWTKGVFVNNKANFVQFMQTSWGCENSDKYQAEFKENNVKLVSKFLSIPFYSGWTEFDFRIGKDNFYKASAKAIVEELTFENTFTLLHFIEQDIPMLFDKFDQWIRVKWYDSFINNNKRKVDETKVEPINS
jgi:hypothetical protein